MPERLYTVQEIADILKVKSQTVIRLIDSGRLPGINVGFGKQKVRRVTEANLNAFIAQPIEQTPRAISPHEQVFSPNHKPKIIPRSTRIVQA